MSKDAKSAIKDLMGRYAGMGADFFSLRDDGDKATVRFALGDEDDLLTGGTGDTLNGFIHPIHEVETGGKKLKVRCLDDPECPLCRAAASNMPSVSRASLKIFIPLMDSAGDYKWWERGQSMIGQLLTYIDQKGPLCNRRYDVIRAGKRGDTKTAYTLIPDDKDDRTIDEFKEGRPKLVGQLVKHWTKEDMERHVSGDYIGSGADEGPAAPEAAAGPGNRRVPF